MFVYNPISQKYLFLIFIFTKRLASVYKGTHAPQGKIFRISVLHTLAIGSAMPAHILLELQKIFPCEAGGF